MKSIAATVARERFADLVHDVSEQKQRFIIVRRGKPCAAVVPLDDLEPIQGRVDQILHEGQQRLRDFADASSDWFWEMDAECRFSYFSTRFSEITGVPQEALLGKTRAETGIPDVNPKEWERHLSDLAAHRSFRNFQHPRTRSDGRVVHLSINGKAIFDEAGVFQGYRGAGSDVSEHMQAEEALRMAHDEMEMRVAERTAELQRANAALTAEIAERTATERAMRESEERFRAIAEASPVPLIITRRSDGEILYANPKVGPAFGLAADAMIGRSISEFYGNPTGREARLVALGKDGYARDNEVEMQKADGSTISTIHSLQTIVYQGEDAVLGGFLDITERKRIEETLRESEAQLDEALEAMSEGFIYFNAENRLVRANSKHRELFPSHSKYMVPGARLEDLLRMQVQNVRLPWAEGREEAWIAERLAQHRNPGEPVEQQFADGRIIRLSEYRTKSGGTVSIRADITELKRTDQALRESEERLRQSTQLARIGYYEWDAVEDRCLFCSDEHARLHGLSAGEYITRASDLGGEFSLTHPGDREAFALAMQKLRSGEPIEIEYRTITPDGKIHYVREIAEPIFDEAGRVVQEIGASQDVTALHLAEERSRQAQKMEAVGQLTGGVAHDFNNLLAVILGNAEIVGERLGGDDRSVQAIVRAADRGAELTQRLLAFSRRQPLRSEVVDLKHIAHGMGRLLRRTLGETIEVGISPAPGLWNALADPGQVENAILNLAINSRDAMSDGGKLIIGIDNAALDESHVASHAVLDPGDYVVLSVSDTGAGMTPEVLEHVFEPFFTTKEVGEGSGLGLSMVYGFAKQSGGDVVIRSELGQGTTVNIYLPRGGEVDARAERDKAAAMPLGHGEAVLVVEDDPDVRALTEAMLFSLDYRVLMAEDAKAGLEAMAAARVDLVLSDVVLTGAMSGPNLAQRVRSIDPGIKFLFMSGYAEGTIGDRAAFSEDIDLLDKPFRKHNLAQKLREVLDR